jgi:hypothetical protein
VTPDSDPTVGQQVSLLGSIADAGPDDTHTVTVEWGDGTSEPVIPSGRAWGASHTYRFQGEVTLTVRVSDDDGDDGAVSRVLTVAAAPDGESGENAAPTAQDVTVETTAGEPVDLRLEGDDPDGDPVTFALLTQPRDGSLSGTAPNLRYTPDDGFDGIDTFTYIASDNLLDSDPATVTVTVTAGDSSAAQPSVPDSAAPPVRWPSAGPTSGPSTSSSPPPAAGVGSDPHPEYLASTGGSVRQALLLAMVLIGAGAGIRMLRPRPRSG